MVSAEICNGDHGCLICTSSTDFALSRKLKLDLQYFQHEQLSFYWSRSTKPYKQQLGITDQLQYNHLYEDYSAAAISKGKILGTDYLMLN